MKLYKRDSLISGILLLMSGGLLMLRRHFETVSIIMAAVMFLKAASAIVQAFTYEASLSEGTDLIDERSQQLRYRSKAITFDIVCNKLSYIVGLAVVFLYILLGENETIYFITCMAVGFYATSIGMDFIYIIALRKLDK